MAEVPNWSYSNPNLLGRNASFQARIAEGQNGLQVIQDAVGEYGIGITLPLTPSEHSPYGMKLAYSTAQAVQSDLINMILTQKGERYSNPEFGTDLHKFLFRQNTPELAQLIEDEVRKSIEEYQSDTGIGVEIIQIKVNRKGLDGNDSHGITVQIKYKVLGSVQQILTTLMNRNDGPVFASYQTTSDQLWNYGTPANAQGGEPPVMIDSGYDDDEFII
tara:strand:+ start:180 stop:833 length:654 start_codon:yes stop_codon:yes gene_type:complete